MDTIETERLILRAFRESDLDDYNEYSSQPETGPNAGWKPHESKEESLKWLKEFIEKDESWAVIEKESGKLIGITALYPDKKRQHDDARNLGYVFNSKFWGKGYATESSLAAIKYAFETMKLELLSINHFTFNERSMSVIKKCGFRYEGTLKEAFKSFDGNVYDDVLYSMTKEEWKMKSNNN
ncbi:MAG: GNAT family N-acetyltransferase [Endomicrobia bacterium]|nr:GNAT family N-acetyltransferase [Endomicrobiia bacterium]MCL2506729.1 GNAT family N-acetyltransferase [Endomicrobiia bacterium]